MTNTCLPVPVFLRPLSLFPPSPPSRLCVFIHTHVHVRTCNTYTQQRNAEALALGVRAICYELNAPKDEVIELILKNQSVLHGREMHLSVADIAHLAMLREPTGRVAE